MTSGNTARIATIHIATIHPFAKCLSTTIGHIVHTLTVSTFFNCGTTMLSLPQMLLAGGGALFSSLFVCLSLFVNSKTQKVMSVF